MSSPWTTPVSLTVVSSQTHLLTKSHVTTCSAILLIFCQALPVSLSTQVCCCPCPGHVASPWHLPHHGPGPIPCLRLLQPSPCPPVCLSVLLPHHLSACPPLSASNHPSCPHPLPPLQPVVHLFCQLCPSPICPSPVSVCHPSICPSSICLSPIRLSHFSHSATHPCAHPSVLPPTKLPFLILPVSHWPSCPRLPSSPSSCPSVCLSACPSRCSSLRQSICPPFQRLSTQLSIHLSPLQATICPSVLHPIPHGPFTPCCTPQAWMVASGLSQSPSLIPESL